MSSNAVHNESSSDARDSLIPDWLVLSMIVMAGSAGYALLAYLLWLWAS